MRPAEIEVRASLQSEEELLYFTLFSLKCGLTYDLLGLVCGMDGSNAKRNQEIGGGTQRDLGGSGLCAEARVSKRGRILAVFEKRKDLTVRWNGTTNPTTKRWRGAKDDVLGKKKDLPSKH